MLKNRIIGLFVLLIFFSFSSGVNGAITKVAKKYSYFSFFASSSEPVGSYDGFTFEDFLTKGQDADEVYKSTSQFGFKYGNLSSKYAVSFGFRYTEHKLQDTVYFARDVVENGQLFDIIYSDEIQDAKFNQFDFELDANYVFKDISQSTIAPYAGFGVKAGIANVSFQEFEDENNFIFTFNLNFGADIKIWQSGNGRNFMTLSSVNSYDLYATANKPKYFNIGGAVKYYFRH